MIIDFRIRPPFKSFMNLEIIQGWRQGLDPDPRKMKPTGFERRFVPSVAEGSIDLMVKEMDAAGITYGVIMGRQTSNPVYGDADNADVYELTRLYPGRFFGFGGIAPTSPTALEDMEQCAKKYGFKGIAIDAGWCNPPLPPGDPALEPIMDLAEQLGLIVVFTMSAYVGPNLSFTDPGPMLPMLRRHKKVNVVFAHGCWPKIQEALGVALLCRNVYLSPDCYFYVRNMPMQMEITRAANSFLKHRLLFASSYPIRGFEQCVEYWGERGLDKDSLACSLYHNAAELLGL